MPSIDQGSCRVHYMLGVHSSDLAHANAAQDLCLNSDCSNVACLELW